MDRDQLIARTVVFLSAISVALIVAISFNYGMKLGQRIERPIKPLQFLQPPQPNLDTCRWYSFELRGDTTVFQVACLKYPMKKEN